jgi:hypothetical protein
LFVSGASQMLKRTHCVYIECWEKHYKNYKYSTTDVIKFLSNSEFSCYTFKDMNSVVKVNAGNVAEDLEDMVALR